MRQSCIDWVFSTRSRCVCAKTLTPAEVSEAATYITTTWYKKSEEEKLEQLALWIQQKKGGDLPFSLPSSQRVGSTGKSTRLCRGAFMKLLFIPASMWRKAEARALPLAAGNAARRINQEFPIKPAPLDSFVVALTKPMGITLLQKSGRIQVAAMKTGSPAERSGKVSIGNVLLAVNGRDVTKMKVDDVVKMIKNGGSISDRLLFSAEKLAHEACSYAKYSNSQGHFQRTRKAEDLGSFFSPLPIGTRENRGSRFLCSVEGCSKFSQGNCRGMCVSHSKESSKVKDSVVVVDTPKKRDRIDRAGVSAPAPASFVTPSPAKKRATNQNKCSVEGCSKYKQSKCNEMCRAHYLESQTKAKSEQNSGGKRKRSDSTTATKYTPPTIAVGERIMKFFADGFYEGKVEQLPTKASSLFFVVYNDGDKEELDANDFWAAYSDYRVQKGLVEPSEFVPESLVVANDGRLAVVRSFRPVSNGIDTMWSYRVHFTGWSKTFDKWMLEVDLRKQTKSTLKWAEKVRTSLGVKDRSKKKVKREGASSTPAPKGAQNESVEVRKMMKTTPRLSRGDHSYPLRNIPSPETKKTASLKKTLPSSEQKHSIKSAKTTSARPTSTQRPAKAAKTKSIPSKSIGCDVVMRQYPLRSSEPHSRRAAVDAKRKLLTPRKDVPKQTKKAVQRKNLSSKPNQRAGVKKANVADADNYILPAIVVGTSILKYFVEGKDYFEGKITKLPTSAKNFYRIRYQDGDEEDMDPLELYMAFSDWCVANNEIPLTKVRNAATLMVCCVSFVWPTNQFNSHHIISLFVFLLPSLLYSYNNSSTQISTCMPSIAAEWLGKLSSSPFAPYSSRDACLGNGPGPTVFTLLVGTNGTISGWTRTTYEK